MNLTHLKTIYGIAGLLIVGMITLSACKSDSNEAVNQEANTEPYISASTQIEAGRYLAIVGGCNDCHTDGYLQTEGKVLEEDWFAGTSLGWRGPWGTTYPPNLRLTVQELTEEEWILVLHERTDLPPMPWMNVNQMSEKDAKALYHYLRSLGPKGEHSPDALEPGVEPQTPYLSLEPQNLPH
jgi:mono/diheme cytochrome c family protein